MRLRPKVSSPPSHLPPVTAPHLGLSSWPALAQVPGCQLLPAWSAGAVDREHMASSTVCSFTTHIMSRGPGSGGQRHSCPSGSLSLYTVSSPSRLSASFLLPLPPLCGGLFPSLSLAAPEAPGGFCCGLCLLYMCFSFVSVSQSQAPFVSTSQSLPPWVSWPFSLSPRTSARSVLHRSRTQ